MLTEYFEKTNAQLDSEFRFPKKRVLSEKIGEHFFCVCVFVYKKPLNSSIGMKNPIH